MKKIMMVSVLFFVFASFAFADGGKDKKKAFQRQYGMAGCGFGSQVMGRDGSQVLAGTTNITGVQFFAITSGTSNCMDSSSEEVAERMDRFVQVNKVALATDMARGNGETLQALASIAGCSDTTGFNSAMQKNFGAIYPNETVQFMDVTDTVISVILDDQGLKKSCGKIRLNPMNQRSRVPVSLGRLLLFFSPLLLALSTSAHSASTASTISALQRLAVQKNLAASPVWLKSAITLKLCPGGQIE